MKKNKKIIVFNWKMEPPSFREVEKLCKQLSVLNPKSYILNSIIIAYEPLWAIGTGKTCAVEKALEMAKFIKSTLSFLNPIKVLYGGSVDSQNIMDFLNCPDIDGVLIGGASVKVKEIKKIIKNLKH